jgi:acyl carrier protein
MPGFRKSLQCPGCANTTLVEFYEPAGAALCPRCGLVFFYDSLRRLEAVQAKRDAEFDFLEFDALHERLQTLNDTGADSLDFVELAMELEESGITVDDLKARKIETLEDLLRFMLERSLHERIE